MSEWAKFYAINRNLGKAKIAARPGVPELGLLLQTQRGSGLRSHAVYSFPLEDHWENCLGLRPACFVTGGPWFVLTGLPTCLRCRAILRRFSGCKASTSGKPA